MSKLKSFDDFVNENLVAKGEYNFYGPGSLMPLVQKLLSEGKGESIIRTYLYSIGVAPWRIEKVFNEMNVPEISLEKKMNEGNKKTFEQNATKFLSDINEEDESIVVEASRWKGKEIFPKWVKPSDIKGYVKSINDLVDGQDYVFYEPGMNSWQAEYEYVGKKQGEHIFKSSAQFSTSPEERFSEKELVAMIKDLELAVMEGESVNEAKKMKPFKKVKVGDKATDYNGDEYKVIATGKVKDLGEYDKSGAAEELDPNEDAIALDDGDGGMAVFSYDPDGAAVYEANWTKDKLIKAFGNNHDGYIIVKGKKYIVYNPDGNNADNDAMWSDKTVTALIPNDGDDKTFKYSEIDDFTLDEGKKKTFEDASAAFLLGLGGSDAINDDKEVKVDEKLNKNTLQVEEGDGEDIDDMIDDLADGDEDETQGPDDEAPDGEDSPEAKIKDGESPSDAVDGAMDDATSKIKDAAEELAKDSKKLAKIKKLLGESKVTEDITRMLNDGAMSELHLLAKEAKDEKDFMKRAKEFVEDMGVKFEKGMETIMKSFWSDMKNESVKETKEVELENGKEVEDKEDIEDEETGDDIQVEEESINNPYMDAVTEGLKHRFQK